MFGINPIRTFMEKRVLNQSSVNLQLIAVSVCVHSGVSTARLAFIHFLPNIHLMDQKIPQHVMFHENFT